MCSCWSKKPKQTFCFLNFLSSYICLIFMWITWITLCITEFYFLFIHKIYEKDSNLLFFIILHYIPYCLFYLHSLVQLVQISFCQVLFIGFYMNFICISCVTTRKIHILARVGWCRKNSYLSKSRVMLRIKTSC